MENSAVQTAEKAVALFQQASADPTGELASTAVLEIMQIIKDLELRVRLLEEGPPDENSSSESNP
jgi:hypothetical protein